MAYKYRSLFYIFFSIHWMTELKVSALLQLKICNVLFYNEVKIMLNDEFKSDFLSKTDKKHDVTKLLSRELRARSVWGTFSSSENLR